jgi:hypothetical protein
VVVVVVVVSYSLSRFSLARSFLNAQTQADRRLLAADFFSSSLVRSFFSPRFAGFLWVV